MRVSARERTGLRAMIEFARRYGEGPTALSEVARVQDLPLPYLERVVSALRRAGLLSSVRGAHGGYLLTKEPSAVNLGDILRAMEGSLLTVECTSADGSGCKRESNCMAHDVWQLVGNRLRETLDNTSLADLLQ